MPQAGGATAAHTRVASPRQGAVVEPRPPAERALSQKWAACPQSCMHPELPALMPPPPPDLCMLDGCEVRAEEHVQVLVVHFLGQVAHKEGEICSKQASNQASGRSEGREHKLVEVVA